MSTIVGLWGKPKGSVTEGELHTVIEIGSGEFRDKRLVALVPRIEDPEILMQAAKYAEPESAVDAALCACAHDLLGEEGAERWVELFERARVGSRLQLYACRVVYLERHKRNSARRARIAL